MTTLYRITDRCDKAGCTSQHVHDRNGYRRHWQEVEWCEHGNIDEHRIPVVLRCLTENTNHRCAMCWCEGAGLS